MGALHGKDIAARLNEVIKSLESNVEVTAVCGCQVTIRLLQMARLNLLCEMHGISDAELRAFADELGEKQPTRKGSIIYLADRRRAGDAHG